MSFSKRENEEQQRRLEQLPDKLDDYQSSAEERPPAQQKKKATGERARQFLVERLIQEAIERGEFDNLPGKGKPLQFEENPYLEPGQEWAFGLLKRNGVAPEWIERDKEIRRLTEAARAALEQSWQTRSGNRAGWQAAVARFEASLAKINRKIDDFNLMAPSLSLHRPRLRLQDELRRIKNNK